MPKGFLTHLNLNLNELQNAALQRLGTDPASPVQGQVYFNTTSNKTRVYSGTAWVDMEGATGTGDVTQAAASTAAGKLKISAGADKTITDLAIAAGIVKTDGAGVASVAAAADFPILNQNTTGTAANVTGTVAVANGGTGATTLTGLLKGNGTAAFTAAAAGTDYLTGDSTNALTNKTIDANGVGNAITNLEVADFATGVVDNDSALTANSASKLPTQSAVKGYVDNKVTGLAWKAAVRAATTASIANLSNASVTQDGVTLVAGDRLLVKNSASPDGTAANTDAHNGIYVVGTVTTGTAPLTRATDADTDAELRNATMFVAEGTTNADTSWVLTTDGAITVGTTMLTFAQKDAGAVPDATTTTKGKVQLATTAQTSDKSSTTLAVTPSGLAEFTRKKSFTFGDGTATSFTLTHNLNSDNVITQLRLAADNAVVEADITNASTSAVTVAFATAPAANAIKAVVIG